MKILKFGGSSLATAERIRKVVEIVRDADAPGGMAIVVSALGGVTDDLLETARLAAARDAVYNRRWQEIEERHLAALDDVSAPDERAAVRGEIAAAFRDLHDLLHGTYLVREASPRVLDLVSSYGERLSSQIVAAALRREGMAAEPCDARRLVVTGAQFGGAQVDVDLTYERIRRHFAASSHRALQVVTGFIAATPEGQTTTLGRGGSDTTAALLGAALEASDVELWTDVHGVMSADPRIAPAARSIPSLSYDELMELSHFGAKVVHPQSVYPARSRGIRLSIRNTFDPAHPGTVVTAEAPPDRDRPVRGIASIRGVALLRLEGAGMVGVPGIAMRLFGALAKEQVSVILISQASSEHSICFAVASKDVEAARRSVDREFDLERRVGHVDPLIVEDAVTVVAAVGAGMRHRHGIAGRLFGVLGDHGVNVRAICQGSSELNISLVVEAADEARAVNVVHDAFLFPDRRVVELFVMGVGRVGGDIHAQLHEHRRELAARQGVEVRLTAVAGSRAALVDPGGLDPGNAVERLRSAGRPYELEELVASFAGGRGRRVFVDCTASEDVTRCYERLLEKGADVVTANKLRIAGPRSSWEAIRHLGPGRIFFETTIGAGLPVVGTLDYLQSTGDRVRRVEGVFSGTLGFLTDRLGAGRAFSDAVREAHESGYTEPDPRQDLTGNDVARKLLILARVTGRDLEPEDVAVESLLPDASWNELTIDELWRRLPELDGPFAERQAAAARAGRRLCYLARLDDEGARVALDAVGPDHPCFGVRGATNVIAVFTDRYAAMPLVVQGPGAGPAVTAAGVFGDILRAVPRR
jgi:aspartokinase/homoserine dehydrogenase 1